MEGPKIKVVAFNHGEVPMTSSGKEKSTVMRYPIYSKICYETVDF